MRTDEPKIQKSEQVTEQLLQYIKENNLRPGDHLPTEDELAKLFNVSRISIRAATNGLKFFGILNSSRRWGTVIAEMDFSNLFRHPGLKFAFHSLPYEQLQQMRCIMECGLLEEISRNMTDEQYAGLRESAETYSRLCAEDASIMRLIDVDYAFHCRLISISKNQIMLAMLQLLEAIVRYSDPVEISKERRDLSRREHRAILDALYEHKVDLARSIMRIHLMRTYTSMEMTDESETATSRTVPTIPDPPDLNGGQDETAHQDLR